jgi:hypothetical protein
MIRLIVIGNGCCTWTDYADLCSAIYVYEVMAEVTRWELHLVYAESGVDVDER